MRVAEFDYEKLRAEPVGTVWFGVGPDGRPWEAHVCTPGGVVGGNLDPRWTLVAADPMTVRPSVQCGGCGLHGWITDDQWVPC